jgi:hypothetical protein
LLTGIGQKKASSRFMATTRDTHKRQRETSSGKTHLFNI